MNANAVMTMLWAISPLAIMAGISSRGRSKTSINSKVSGCVWPVLRQPSATVVGNFAVSQESPTAVQHQYSLLVVGLA